MIEPLDLDALEAFLYSDDAEFSLLWETAMDLLAELRATRAERDQLRADFHRYVDVQSRTRQSLGGRVERAEAERDNAAEMLRNTAADRDELWDRAERAEAERDAAIQSGWFQADRAERAEAAIARVEALEPVHVLGTKHAMVRHEDVRAALRDDQ